MSVLVASALPDPVLVASSFLTSRGPVSLPQAFPRLPAKDLSPFWAMCMPFWTEEALGLFKDTPHSSSLLPVPHKASLPWLVLAMAIHSVYNSVISCLTCYKSQV